MAVAVGLSTDKAQYVKGEKITATIDVDGEEPGGEKVIEVSCVVEVAGVEYTAKAPVTISWPTAPVRVLGVTAPGIHFEHLAGDEFTWVGTAA